MALQRDHRMALLQRLKTPFMEDLPDGEGASLLGPRFAGDLLRQQREALGLDLHAVAAALRIKPRYLAALEAGRPELLPGPAYAIGFVRAYGDHLRLDGNEILRRFKAESAALDAKPDLAFPIPLGDRGVPGGGMLLVALILALCGYGTWYYVSTSERSRPERVAQVPAELAAAAPDQQGGNPSTSATAEALTEDQLTTALATSQAPGPIRSEPAPTENWTGALPPTPPAAGSGPPSAPLAPPPAAALPPGDASYTYGVVDGTARIVIRATADSWIRIRGTEQSVLFERSLKAGEIYLVPNQPGVSMRTGNAGGIEITVDGKPTPSLGPNGAVRNVPLEPQALLAKTAAGG
jgi:cytoskeleton protein RodZ